MEENWKDIKKYEGLYKVSDTGNICSVKKKRILTPGADACGYVHVGLSKNGKVRTITIHRLVALAFVKNNAPDIFTCVNHINGIKTDNRAVNLEWCDRAYNNKHAFENGLIKPKKRSVVKIIDGEVVARYDSITEAAAMNNKNKETIFRSAHKKGKILGPAIYEFENK